MCLTPNFSDIAEASSIPGCEPSTSTNSIPDHTPTIMKMQITRENKCTSAARANNLLDEFSTPQLSKMILNTNGTHGYYQRILGQYLSPYPYDALIGFRWVPNGWKLEPIESTPKNVSFEQLFLDKVKPIQEKQIYCCMCNLIPRGSCLSDIGRQDLSLHPILERQNALGTRLLCICTHCIHTHIHI